jgi:hypothetical protein
VVSASASPASPSIAVLQTTLADQTELLQGWQTHIESFLERAEAALSKLSLVPALCEGHVLPLSCEQLEAPKSIVSVVPMVEDVVLGVLRVDDVDAAGLFVPAPSRSPLVDDNYIKKYNEFYDFLNKWVADQPGSGNKRGCLLKKKPNREKAKRNKSKKGGVIRKTPAISRWRVLCFYRGRCSCVKLRCVVQVSRVPVVVHWEGHICGHGVSCCVSSFAFELFVSVFAWFFKN